MKQCRVFEVWMDQVDRHLEALAYGLSSDDLDDEDYRLMYDVGHQPRFVAKKILRAQFAHLGFTFSEE